MSALRVLFGELFLEIIEVTALRRRGAAALAMLISSGRYDGARLLACARRDDGAELLTLEVLVPLGQRTPINPIHEVEPLAIFYPSDEAVPSVYPLRDDFPEVPHLNIADERQPRSLCLFEMPADEALRIATPFVLVERTRHWLRETAHGRLHGDDQPLDPLFAASRHSIVLPPGGVRDSEVLAGFKRSDQDDSPVLLERVGGPVSRGARGMPTFACVSLVTPALPHGRLQSLPRTVWRLLDVYRDLGVDLLDPLRAALKAWAQDKRWVPLLDQRCLLLLTTPIERSPGQTDGAATKGFFIDRKGGELGEALGVMVKSPDGSFGLILGQPTAAQEALAAMPAEAVNIRWGFDRALARAASGHPPDEAGCKVALIGAGALGSQVAIDAARGGMGEWSIIDPDHLMPHNLARHALSADYVGVPKAIALADEIVGLLGPDAASSTVDDVRLLGESAPQLLEANLVIDASASVPCARWLACTSLHTAPTSSVFLNPSGQDLVVLREGSGRTPRLDHLEMLYYWLLACDPILEGHLRTGGAIMPSGGCRNPSVQLAQTAVAAAAAHAVEELFQAPPTTGGEIILWHRSEVGILRLHTPGEPFVEVELDGWTVAVRCSIIRQVAEARVAAGGLETGGILVGGWDRQHRKAWVVAHLDPPPDSEHSATGFVRGLVGVHRTLEHIETATAVNLTYVGEWHTHPEGHASQPSEDDRLLMRWIGDAVAFSDVPPLMIIAGHDGIRLMLGSVNCSVMLPESRMDEAQ